MTKEKLNSPFLKKFRDRLASHPLTAWAADANWNRVTDFLIGFGDYINRGGALFGYFDKVKLPLELRNEIIDVKNTIVLLCDYRGFNALFTFMGDPSDSKPFIPFTRKYQRYIDVKYTRWALRSDEYLLFLIFHAAGILANNWPKVAGLLAKLEDYIPKKKGRDAAVEKAMYFGMIKGLEEMIRVIEGKTRD